MCSPNAFFYQQMVTAANAYWLNFFLKRDINVVCWNYRGYGESELGRFTYPSPSMAKSDAEHVLSDAVTKFNLKGKIGVYGRSIGGITACHLAAKFKEVVKVLIIDRSLSELTDVAEAHLRGETTLTLMKGFVNGWVCDNAKNFGSA
jgi:pimeloyl-ACP methyl ester carboxylesterase